MKNPFEKKINKTIEKVLGLQEEAEKPPVVNDIPDTTCIEYLRGLISPLALDVTDLALKKEIKKLAEEIQYSDPVSNDSVKTIEKNLTDMSGDLIKAVYDGENENALAKCREMRSALRMRNTLVKQGK